MPGPTTESLAERFDVMIGDVSSLKADVSSLKTDVASLKVDVAVLKTDVSSLKVDVAVLKADLGSLQGEVGLLRGEVQELRGDVRELREDFVSFRSEVRTLVNVVRWVGGMIGAALLVSAFSAAWWAGRIDAEVRSLSNDVRSLGIKDRAQVPPTSQAANQPEKLPKGR